MVDSAHLPGDTPDLACPWCSTAVTPETAVCPSCNAILISEEEHDLPGVTAVDGAIARGEKRLPQRGRLLSWFGGESADQPATTSDAQAIAPPDEEVQREILRLELAARISNLQAEADSILSDALVEGRVADLPDGLLPLALAEANAETPQETADALVAAAMTADLESGGEVATETETVVDIEAEVQAQGDTTEPGKAG